MISHLFLHQGRESFFILALTSSTGKCDAARVILATFLFSSSAHNSCENSTTASNLVSDQPVLCLSPATPGSHRGGRGARRSAARTPHESTPAGAGVAGRVLLRRPRGYRTNRPDSHLNT